VTAGLTSITGPDGLEVAATFHEGRQIDAERVAFEAAKRLHPKD